MNQQENQNDYFQKFFNIQQQKGKMMKTIKLAAKALLFLTLTDVAVALTKSNSAQYWKQDLTVKQSEAPDQSTPTKILSRTTLVSLPGVNQSVIGFGGAVEREMFPNVIAGGSLDYWKLSFGDESFSDGQEVSLQDLSLGMYAKYIFPVAGNLKPFASFGLGYHMFSVSAGSESVGLTKTGFDIALGSAYTINSDWFADAQFRIRNIDYFDYQEFGIGVGRLF